MSIFVATCKSVAAGLLVAGCLMLVCGSMLAGWTTLASAATWSIVAQAANEEDEEDDLE